MCRPTPKRTKTTLTTCEQDINITTMSTIIQRHSTHTISYCPFSPLPSNRSKRYKILILFNPVTPSQIATSGIPIPPKVRFICTPAHSHKFHALTFPTHTSHLQHLWLDLHLESNQRSVVKFFCRNSQCV